MLRKKHNFLHAKPLHYKGWHPAWRGVGIAFAVLGVFLAVILLAVVPLWFISERVYGRAEQGKQNLEMAQEKAKALQLGEAATSALAAEKDFSAAHDDVEKLLWLRGLPFVGPHIKAADRLLVSGTQASHAVGNLLTVAHDLTSTLQQSEQLSLVLKGSLPDAAKLFKELTPEHKREVLKAFHEGAPKMADALDSIDLALEAFDAIPQDEIAAKVVETIKPLRPKLLALRDTLKIMLPVAQRAPSVLGYPDERRYLFFFQNNTELRPTGGFLGVYGMARVRDAELLQLVTDDVYSLDGPAEAGPRPAPPAPIKKYIGIEKWFLRDANWSPDFVTSARQMAQFYADEYYAANKLQAPLIDGVVAVDTEVAKDILTLTGPITVDGKTFTADNVVDTLEFAVEKGFVREGVAYGERKQIVGDLVAAVIDNLEAMPLSKLLTVLDVAKSNLNEGHVLLAMRDVELENDILDRDWGGLLKPVRGDYLSWIDANLASLKTDPTVQRTLTYKITHGADGHDYATAAMTYKHTGRFDWKTTRYRTYARVYVPAGSKLVSVNGAMENDKIKDPGRHAGTADVGNELGRTWFGAFISIEPGETKTLEFRYQLAPSVAAQIAGGAYLLDVEKQPGTVAHGLTLDLDLGKKVTAAEPAEDRSQWGDAIYRFTTDLRLDRSFTLGL